MHQSRLRAQVGEEALAIAVWSALRHQADPARGVRIAANHDGETDSTGSIAAQILGSACGTAWLDEFDLMALELRGEIEELARRLDSALPAN
ncbi:MAG: ADP-ribosylglycohydrolase family protein [bacterium]|nr:ADP-ribosylglycohydrolase family protein [bacterium]